MKQWVDTNLAIDWALDFGEGRPPSCPRRPRRLQTISLSCYGSKQMPPSESVSQILVSVLFRGLIKRNKSGKKATDCDRWIGALEVHLRIFFDEMYRSRVRWRKVLDTFWNKNLFLIPFCSHFQLFEFQLRWGIEGGFAANSRRSGLHFARMSRWGSEMYILHVKYLSRRCRNSEFQALPRFPVLIDRSSPEDNRRSGITIEVRSLQKSI